MAAPRGPGIEQRNRMKTKRKLFILARYHSFSVISTAATVLSIGLLTGPAQTSDYLYSGSEESITLDPGIYYITAYGAQGGSCYQNVGGQGAEMEGEFSFATEMTLTVLIGGAGGNGSGQFGPGGGGGGGSFVVNGSTPLLIAGGGGGGGAASNPAGNTGTSGGSGGYAGGAGGVNGGGGQGSGLTGGGGGFSGGGGGMNGSSFLSGGLGGGSGGFGGGGGGGGFAQAGGGGGGYSGGGGGGHGENNIDFGFGGGGGGSYIASSAIADLTEISGAASPDGSANGEIIITEVPEPTTHALACLSGLSLLLLRRDHNQARPVAKPKRARI